MQKNNAFNKFYFIYLKNDVLLVNHESFFQGKESL